jgi:hypothetical protein
MLEPEKTKIAMNLFRAIIQKKSRFDEKKILDDLRCNSNRRLGVGVKDAILGHKIAILADWDQDEAFAYIIITALGNSSF